MSLDEDSKPAVPGRLAAIAQGCRESGDYQPLLAELPYASFMDFEASVVDGRVRLRMPYAPMLVGNTALPALHGGTLGACLEMAALLQLLHSARANRIPRTIDFTVDFLRPGRPVDTWADAELQREGRRVANLRMRCWQEDEARPIVTGRGNFLLV